MAITKPSPYVPSFLKAAMSGSRPLTLTWSDVSDTNIRSTSSFQYDASSEPLKSTQQLNVDWSNFQNHTFFMSAEAKVNLSFDSIINGFPFDGSRRETEMFFEKLTGFDKWVFDQFPKYKGSLMFSGTYISVQNRAGAMFPELSKDSSGQQVLNPKNGKSLTVEMQLFLPNVSNDVEAVFQLLNGNTQGFSLLLTQSNSLTTVDAQFIVVSGSSYMTVPVTLAKGTFNHVAVTLNRDNGLPYLQSFLNSNPISTSITRVEMGDMDIDGSQFIIGSGSAIVTGATTITPKQLLSGTIDEFRVFHSSRTSLQQSAYASKALFATSELVLYYRFNEPAPPLTTTLSDPINAIVLDSSGNALHALVNNFTGSLRINSSTDPLNPMVNERPDSIPVLFPAYPATLTFNQTLLASASTYDQENPNLITKLVPQHYLLEGAQQDGFIEAEGTANDAYGGSGIPGQGRMGNVQILVSLLYIWARFFDEIKLFIDSFSMLRTVDYQTNETVPDNFLIDLVKSYGFHLPPLFNDSTLEQYIRGENVDLQEISTNITTLKNVQNQLLRRVLINLPDVLKSKGTQHSIRSFLRAVGIDPGNNVRIREFGGPTTQQLAFTRESKLEPGAMVQFMTSSLAVTPFLTARRSEPGFPEISSLTSNDSLLTSGSWTWEGIVRYTPSIVSSIHSATQSLARMCVTGTLNGGSSGLLANLIAVPSIAGSAAKIVLYARPGTSTSSPILRMELDQPSTGIFNFDRWNVSFGCQRNDDGLASQVSSSYFLRVGFQNDGKIEISETTASYFFENPTGESNAFRTLSGSFNASGSFIAVGSAQTILSGSSTFLYLNDISSSSRVPAEARTTAFDGRMSNVRFWSKALTVDEWREHVRNYNSVGVEDPLTNWNYVQTRSGSFGRLRMNTMIKQDVRSAIATASLGLPGSIQFIDFSENGFHMTGSGFPIDQETIVGEIFDMSYLSPYFDEAASNEKFRVRSYQDLDIVEQTPWAGLAPVYEIVASEQPTDDVRFIIEFSLIDALNRDIITMFATFDALDNALGNPELLFSPSYPDLENLRNIYFNRIKEKLNFQAFFEFFRWFDTSIGTFIQQLVPRKTLFKGTNFTIESHMLERHKQEYLSSEIYLQEGNRKNLDSYILMQQIVGMLKKY